MTYIIMDLEWNQPVSKNSYPYLKIGDSMSNEIIQIGAYKVTDKLEIVDSFCAYVKPKYYKKLNSFVKKVTQIDKAKVCEGESFCDAIERFARFCGDDFCLFTWGSDDVYVMKQNLEFYGVDKTFIKKWYDMQTIFSKVNLGESSQRSLSFAMEYFGIEKKSDRHLHDALDDAYYTARVFVHHDISSCLKDYTQTSDFGLLCDEYDDTRYGSFYTKNKAMSDTRVSNMFCPACGKCIETRNTWLHIGGKYVRIAKCTEHGEFISRIKINKHLDGRFYVNKVTKSASAQLCEEIKNKYKTQRVKKTIKRKHTADAV